MALDFLNRLAWWGARLLIFLVCYKVCLMIERRRHLGLLKTMIVQLEMILSKCENQSLDYPCNQGHTWPHIH